MKKYKCVEDYINGDFCVGLVKSFKDWKICFKECFEDVPMSEYFEHKLKWFKEKDLIEFARQELFIELEEVK